MTYTVNDVHYAQPTTATLAATEIRNLSPTPLAIHNKPPRLTHRYNIRIHVDNVTRRLWQRA